jgi:hypothetical protein
MEPQYKMAMWRETMKLISQYDWAVEGGTQPQDSEMSRSTAAVYRGELVKLARQFA